MVRSRTGSGVDAKSSAPSVSLGVVRWLAILLAVAVIAVIAHDLWSPPSRGVAEWVGDGAADEYRGELFLEGVKYNGVDRTLTAAVRFRIRASKPSQPVDDVVIRLAPDEQGNWDLLDSKTCTLIDDAEVPAPPGGPDLSMREFDCGEHALGVVRGSGERAYPFDRYNALLTPGGCADVGRQPCLLKNQNVTFSRVTARAADAGLLPVLSRDDGIVLQLERRPFVQHLSIILAVMALIFFGFLWFIGDPKDLFAKSLGFYGTLWALRSLIVPDSVTTFPTAVDYAVLTLFALAFAVVLYRLGASGGSS